MKALKEKKNSLLEEMEGLLNKAKTEVRVFTEEENSRVEEIKKEIRGLEKLIADEEEMRSFDKSKATKTEGEKKMAKEETRPLEVQNEEIRKAIENEKELDITNFEVEERAAIGTPNVGGNGTSIGNIAKTTFANAILKKATDTSDLYKYVRKENFGSALHQRPVQKTKITAFANVKELADYAEKNIDYTPIQLAAHKYGNISIISEECLADTGYNIMAELLEQYGEGAGETLDKLMVTGDAQVEGLAKFVNDGNGDIDDGAYKIGITSQNLGKVNEVIKSLMEMYNKLPQKYAKNGTWVISTEMAGLLNTATDANGRALLFTDFTQVPFGGKPTPMFLGRPVVVSDHVQAITGASQHNCMAFFGDLSKALILGLRQNFTIKSSTEYKFAQDGIAVKGTMRFDIKKGLAEAIAIMVRSN